MEKKLEELDIPNDVLWLKMMAYSKQPVGVSIYEKIISENPSYFPEETEHRRKLALVPESVNEAFAKEWAQAYDEIYKDAPLSKGLLYWIEHEDEFLEYQKLANPLSELLETKTAELRKKYYSPYGL